MSKIKKVVFIVMVLALCFGSCITANAAINLSETARTDTSCGLKWTAAKGASFYILYFKGTDHVTRRLTLRSNVLSHTFKSPKDSYYYCAIGAYNKDGRLIDKSPRQIKICTTIPKIAKAKVVSWQKKKGAVLTVADKPRTASDIEYRFYNSKGKKVITKGTTPYLSVFIKKLKPNQIYKLKVRAVSSFDGRKTYGAWKTYTVVPQPVQNTPKVMLDGSVKVTWKKVKGATKYIVYGSTKPDKGYKKIKSVGKGETSYRVKKIYGKELELNNNYFIKVVAQKGKMKSDNTNGYRVYIFRKIDFTRR